MSAYRRMLRQVCGYYYRPDGELTWVEWVQQSTKKADDVAKQAGITDWLEEQRRRKFRWAGKVSRLTDGRWTHTALVWSPDGGIRDVGRPLRRWGDCLEKFAATFAETVVGTDWMLMAQIPEDWADLEDDYVDFLESRGID